MQKTYDDITGQTRWESPDHVLFTRGGLVWPLQYLKVRFVMSRTDARADCWIVFSAQSQHSMWDTDGVVHAMVDSHRQQFQGDIREIREETGALFYDRRNPMFAECIYVHVTEDWLRRLASATVAKVRVAFRDAELPPQLKADAAAILAAMA